MDEQLTGSTQLQNPFTYGVLLADGNEGDWMLMSVAVFGGVWDLVCQRIVESGGADLADRIENSGYDDYRSVVNAG